GPGRGAGRAGGGGEGPERGADARLGLGRAEVGRDRPDEDAVDPERAADRDEVREQRRREDPRAVEARGRRPGAASALLHRVLPSAVPRILREARAWPSAARSGSMPVEEAPPDAGRSGGADRGPRARVAARPRPERAAG